MKKPGLLELLLVASLLAAIAVTLLYEGRIRFYAQSYATLGNVVLLYHVLKKKGPS